VIAFALLACAAAVSFLTAGYLAGIRSGSRARAAVERTLARAEADRSRMREERTAWERERGGLIAQLAAAEADTLALAARKDALLGQLAARPPLAAVSLRRRTKAKA